MTARGATTVQVDGNGRAADIIRAVAAAIERRAGMLDAADTLETVTVIVRMNSRTGQARKVIIRTEDQGDV